jgi:perosamine synthetase
MKQNMNPTFSIPFGGRSHSYTKHEIEKVREIMISDAGLTQGEELRSFEERFAEFLGVERAFAVSSATTAIELVAQLVQLKAGDEVIIPAHTFTSSAYPFVKQGANLVWADIDLKTRVVGVSQIEQCVSRKTRVIVVPHLYGYGADMPEIMSLARKIGAVVVEDVAQAIGVYIESKMAGAYGDFSVFSFHAQKNMTTLGEGGMLVARDPKISRMIPQIRHNGHCDFAKERQDYWIPAMGNVDLPELNGDALWPNNFCLGEVQCALGKMLLDRVEDLNLLKRERALRFIASCAAHPQLEFHWEDSARHNYHLLVARLDDGERDDFIRTMAYEHGVQCIVQYYPLYRYAFYKKLGFGAADCPNTDNFFDSMISFPFHHTLSETQLEQIVEATQQTLSKG